MTAAEAAGTGMRRSASSLSPVNSLSQIATQTLRPTLPAYRYSKLFLQGLRLRRATELNSDARADCGGCGRLL